MEKILKATHTGKLQLGEESIPCAVLENGQRIISEFGISNALKSRSGASKRMKTASSEDGAPIPIFLASKNIIPYITNELRDGPLKPINYTVRNGKRVPVGYDATVLPRVCDIWLQARQDGVLNSQQEIRAVKAEILVRALANVGIVALVDEATGYQEKREKDALAKLLSVYLTEERLKWAKRFPDVFYKEIYRLNNWNWPPEHSSKRPGIIGQYTNDVVYERLPTGVLDRLKELNPTDEASKRRRFRHHQFLSEDIGQPDLQKHLLQVIALMRASRSWKGFLGLLERVFPKGKTYQLDMLKD